MAAPVVGHNVEFLVVPGDTDHGMEPDGRRASDFHFSPDGFKPGHHQLGPTLFWSNKDKYILIQNVVLSP